MCSRVGVVVRFCIELVILSVGYDFAILFDQKFVVLVLSYRTVGEIFLVGTLFVKVSGFAEIAKVVVLKAMFLGMFDDAGRECGIGGFVPGFHELLDFVDFVMGITIVEDGFITIDAIR